MGFDGLQTFCGFECDGDCKLKLPFFLKSDVFGGFLCCSVNMLMCRAGELITPVLREDIVGVTFSSYFVFAYRSINPNKLSIFF